MHLLRRTLPALTLLATACTMNLHAAQKAVLQGAVAGTQQVSFDVYLPLQNRDLLEQTIANLHDSTSGTYQHWLTPAQFNQQFAASAASVKSIVSQLQANNLTATQVSPHYLRVTGSASAVEHALSTQLRTGVFPNGRKQVVASTAVSVPSTISGIGGVVTGLSGTIRMKPHAHRISTANRYSTAGAYWFDDLKQAYQWPSYSSYNGKGVTIGIVIDGDYNPSDMDLYFGHEKLATPNFSTVQVLGGAPYDPNGDSFETHLDMQQTGGMAPKANIIVYNIPDLSDDSIMAGLSQILQDNKTDVVSMSFGGPEVYYTAAYNQGEDFTYILREEDDLFAQGNAQGITFVASSGDAGALDALPVACFYQDTCTGTFLPSVEFPASSPHVVGVGGTNLKTTYAAGNLNSAYISEEAFADPLTEDIFYGTGVTGGYWGSGGGNSVLFKKPLYQRLVNTGSNTVRTVPDVALHMGGCPGGAICSADDSADVEAIAGGLTGVIGTSASAPDFAGLTALAVQRYGTRLGNENYYIYALAALQNTGLPLVKAFHTGIPGFNGLYSTTPSGYNRVLGNGTVIGKQFLLAPLVPSAGVPQTTSNP
jgi:kumamolisin